VAMVVVMLSGPVLHHRKTIGQLAQLWLVVDGSQSMGLTDGGMDAGRKILIAQRLGLLSGDLVKLDVPRAAEALAEAEGVIHRALGVTAIDPAAWKKVAQEYSSRIEEARGHLSGVIETERLERMQRELGGAIAHIEGRSIEQIEDRIGALRELGRLGEATRRWQTELREVFDKSIEQQMGIENSPLRTALSQFDTLSRTQRLQALLMEGEPGKALLGQLARNYEVRLATLDGFEAQTLWQPTARDSTVPSALPKPSTDFTDLGSGLKTGIGSRDPGQRSAVVLFSDGQHNASEAPVEPVRNLGAQGTPVFTVGLGSAERPRDLAVIKAGGPESVFHEDVFRGEIVIKDDAPAGRPFTVTIRDGEQVVWEQRLLTENRPLRRIPFDFSVKPLAEARQRAAGATAAGTEVSSFPIDLRVSLSTIEGERELGNNEGSLRFRAVTQKRRILIVDGRPRWETRYLRNLFERDEQWEVNCVIAGSHPGEPGFKRGDRPEQFPTDQAKIDAHDVIFFGDVPRAAFRDEEIQWLREFVEQRGGALVFIDGPRGSLRGYGETPLAPVLPVEFPVGDGMREGLQPVALTERAAPLAAFALAPERELNRETWSKLPAPHWISGAKPLPGAEVLLEADAGGERFAAAVLRPFGAGRVYYQAFDDSWRWRREVADQWHVKFWNQLANFVAEPPFAVRDKFVAIDAGAITYHPGDTADLRVRLRDGEGKPVTSATVDAVLYKEGQKAATIRLSADEGGGLFRGRTAPLEAGKYEIAVETPAIPPSQLVARTEFKVEPRESGELIHLSLNEDLLRQMAEASGGRYFREENFDRVLELLAPMTQGRVIESDTVLWQSWWWFLPIVGLLTIEWLLRKRAGML